MSVRRRLPEIISPVVRILKGDSNLKPQTIHWGELLPWQQDNHYIQTGYRPSSLSFRKSFASLLYLHNESVNIYSHYIGTLLFATLASGLYTLMRPRYKTAMPTDVLVFSCFFIGAGICLGISGTYHTISNHSPLVARWGNKLDYVGIVFLIVGSFIPSIFYGFYCHPQFQKFYWTMISMLGLACTAVSVFDRFRTPAWRPYRAGIFVSLGLSALFPVGHGVRLYGLLEMRNRIGLFWLVLQGLLYILGAALYAARWPECSWSKRFDIWGSSHQLFHILVVMAAICHLYGLLIAFDFHHTVLGAECFLVQETRQ
ncbi:BgTH12-00408 [Blumeria graminis f. sp. triticale]|uniref:BgTH12-00408 n=1 Tax=Blumeria graminis f. sp. triticale TaxID=1689686 RepID=A0A9W4GGT3_BLUGR|nr:BgTH12-00408 [Blumeria graminis f. sp. triticale]